jgi:lactate permease
MEDDADLAAEESGEPTMSLARTAAPYGVLTVLAIGALVIAPVEDLLARLSVGLPFPEVTTGFGVENEAEDAYQSFEPLTHPGTFLLLAVLAAFLIYRGAGAFGRRSEKEGESHDVLPGLAGDAIPAAVSIVGFLVLARVLDHSGQIDVLALGIAEVSPAPVFAVMSTFIGVVGAFMTSSNTASNVLFGPLQDGVASAEDLSQSGILAAQSTGGAIGNAIAPANIVLGTSTTGAAGKEGAVLRMTLPWTLVVALLTGGVTLLLV